MQDSQHLKNLLKQKELIEGHLAWINDEIHKHTAPQGQPSPKSKRLEPQNDERILPGASGRQSDKSQASPIIAPEETPKQEDATLDIIEQLGPDTRSASNQTKFGCFIYFGIAVAALAGLITYIYTAY